MKRTELAPITQALAGATVAAFVQRASGGSVQVAAVLTAALGATLPAITAFVLSQLAFRAWWAQLGPPKRIAVGLAFLTAAIAAVRLSPASYWLLASAAAWVLIDIGLAAVGRAWLLRHPLAFPILGAVAVVLWKHAGAWWLPWMMLGYGTHLAFAAWIGWPGLPWGRALHGLRMDPAPLVRWVIGTLVVLGLLLTLIPAPSLLRGTRAFVERTIGGVSHLAAPRGDDPPWTIRLIEATRPRRWMPLIAAAVAPISRIPTEQPPPRWPLAAAVSVEAAVMAAGILAGKRRLPPRLRRAKRMPWPDAALQAAGAGAPAPAGRPQPASVTIYIPSDLPAAAEALTVLLPIDDGTGLRMALTSVAPPDRFGRGQLCEYTIRYDGAPRAQVTMHGAPVAALRCGIRGAGESWVSPAFPRSIDQVLAEALRQARAHGHAALTEWHVLRVMAALSDNAQDRALLPEVVGSLRRFPSFAAAGHGTGMLVAPTLAAALDHAAALAASYPDPETSWFPLWVALASPPAATAAFLERRHYTVPRLHASWIGWKKQQHWRAQAPPPPRSSEEAPRRAEAPPQAEAAAQQPAATQAADPLAEFTVDLVAEARAGRLPPVIGAQDVLEELTQNLLKAELSTPVLVGEAGVGKTAAVHKLAHLLASGSEALPQRLRGMKLVELQHGRMVAGTVWRGMFEERLQRLLDALERDPHVILFIDEVHLIMGLGQAEMGAAAGAAQYLKPVLTRGRIRLIGATTPGEYRKFIERDPAMARRMTKVIVPEPTMDDARAILRGVGEWLERRHDVRIEPEVVARSVEWARRYLPKEKRLPGSAKDLLDAACAAVVARNGKVVSADDLAEVISRKTRIPVTRITTAEAEKLRALEAALAERVVGQDAAVSRVAEAIRRARAGMADPRRPVATFLFYGPTGVGKTELAKAVAAQLFDTDEAFHRINLAEYRNPSDAARLTGTASGYAGSEEGGQLTEAVRRRPYSVVLLDEFDKAHPDVLHTFLSVFDEGRLVDGLGQVADFTNVLVIATSNFGAEAWRGIDPEDPVAVAGAADRALGQLRAILRPELFNRLAPVAFAPLPCAALLALVRKRVQVVVNRAAAQMPGIQIEIADEVHAALARAGYDPELGARPLERVIEDRLAGRIADAMIGASSGVPLRLRAVVDPRGTVTVERTSS